MVRSPTDQRSHRRFADRARRAWDVVVPFDGKLIRVRAFDTCADEAARDAPVDVMKVMAVIAGHALVRLRQSGTVDVERLLQRFASAPVATSPVSHQPVDESIGEHQPARSPGP